MARPAVGGAFVNRPEGLGSPTLAGSEAAAPDEFAQTCVLLLLSEQPLRRAELSERLCRVGLLGSDRAWTDGVLGALLQHGLVRIGDRVDGAAPAGYQLTAQGRQHLGDAADELRSTRVLLSRFLARSGERFVAGSERRA